MIEEDKIFTVDVENYAGKRCQCRKCNKVSVATFLRDYYSTEETDENGNCYLQCENCMLKEAFKKEAIGSGSEPAEPPF